MGEHTPGPWKQVLTGIYADDVQVAYTCFHEEQNIPNARLIAAAPELLEAAQTLAGLGWFNEHKCADKTASDAMAAMRTAVSKATGQ